MKNGHEALHIGLTGHMASGKGEVIRVARELGFKSISLSDMVRTEGRSRYGSPSREQLQDTGNDLRRQGGPGILGRMVADAIIAQNPGLWIIDGIRNPAEVLELRRLAPFVLLGIHCERQPLLRRLLSRQRSDDLADEAELSRRLDREWGIGEPVSGQQVGPCMAMADQQIDNQGSLEELERRVIRFIQSQLQETKP